MRLSTVSPIERRGLRDCLASSSEPTLKEARGIMYRIIAIASIVAAPLIGQQEALLDRSASPAGGEPAAEGEVIVPAGTRVPLVMVNSVSSKHSQPGDPVYLECVFPVVVGGRILIPAGSRVSGQVMYSKRPGRVKGRGKLAIRAETIILPNGVIRSLMGRPGALDGRSPDNFDRETGTVSSPGQKGEDAGDIVETAVTGAVLGTMVGSVGRNAGKGLGIGAAAGAAAGVANVLLTRGPDATLDRGTHVEMLLERELRFTEDELAFPGAVQRPVGSVGAGPDRNRDRRDGGRGGRFGRFPR